MCFSDCDGKDKGISLAGQGASEREEEAEDAILFFHSSNVFSFQKHRVFPLVFFGRAYTFANYLRFSRENKIC